MYVLTVRVTIKTITMIISFTDSEEESDNVIKEDEVRRDPAIVGLVCLTFNFIHVYLLT